MVGGAPPAAHAAPAGSKRAVPCVEDCSGSWWAAPGGRCELRHGCRAARGRAPSPKAAHGHALPAPQRSAPCGRPARALLTRVPRAAKAERIGGAHKDDTANDVAQRGRHQVAAHQLACLAGVRGRPEHGGRARAGAQGCRERPMHPHQPPRRAHPAPSTPHLLRCLTLGPSTAAPKTCWQCSAQSPCVAWRVVGGG